MTYHSDRKIQAEDSPPIHPSWIIRKASTHPYSLPYPGVNPPLLCPVSPSALAWRSVMEHLREPGTNGPDDPGALVHGPADLEWSRADIAAIRERTQETARQFIAAGASFSLFVEKCVNPRNDIVRAWIERERITRGNLRALWDGEGERLSEPSPNCDPWTRERFYRKREALPRAQRKTRDIAQRIARARA